MPASASTDEQPPTSTVLVPTDGATLPLETLIISGTAQDADGQVAGVEISTDNGTNWHPAKWLRDIGIMNGYRQSLGTITILSRAVDDSGNLERPRTRCDGHDSFCLIDADSRSEVLMAVAPRWGNRYL